MSPVPQYSLRLCHFFPFSKARKIVEKLESGQHMEALLLQKRIRLVEFAMKLHDSIGTMHAAELHTCVQALAEVHSEFPVRIQCGLVNRRCLELIESDPLNSYIEAWRPWPVDGDLAEEFDALTPSFYAMCCCLQDRETNVHEELKNLEDADGNPEEAQRIKDLQSTSMKLSKEWQVGFEILVWHRVEC